MLVLKLQAAILACYLLVVMGRTDKDKVQLERTELQYHRVSETYCGVGSHELQTIPAVEEIGKRSSS
jgi:hypothetical protein